MSNKDRKSKSAPSKAELSAASGSEWVYVRVEVLPADPGRVMLLNGLAEKTGIEPAPDVVPHTDPGAISFRHARMVANDEDEAYAKGWDLLPPPQPGSVCNDYVVAI